MKESQKYLKIVKWMMYLYKMKKAMNQSLNQMLRIKLPLMIFIKVILILKKNLLILLRNKKKAIMKFHLNLRKIKQLYKRKKESLMKPH